MEKLYTVSEVCRLTSITSRTLHYYDEINLLKPTSRFVNGKRLYAQNELIKLQKIISLKYIGFKLVQIKKIISDKHFDLIQLLKMQAQALNEEMVRNKKISILINSFIADLEVKKPINWENINKITEIINVKNHEQKKWYENYLNASEQESLSKYFKTRTSEWQSLLEEVKKNIHKSHESKSAKKIVEKWFKLADQAYGNNPELKKKLWEAYKAGVIPNVPFDSEVTEYLAKVFAKI